VLAVSQASSRPSGKEGYVGVKVTNWEMKRVKSWEVDIVMSGGKKLGRGFAVYGRNVDVN
jgi:hypothetical protein